MPTDEFIAVVQEYEGASKPKDQIAALEKMWLLQDPEIIQVVNLIYEDAGDRKVKAKAAEVLGQYKGLYNALRKPQTTRGGRGRAGLRNLLVVTLLLLLSANGALFFLSTMEDEDNNERDLVAERANLIDQIEEDMQQSIALSRNLRDTATDFQDGASVEDVCAREFDAIPEPVVLVDDQITFFPDIATLTNDENSDYLLVFDGLDANFTAWETNCALNDPNAINATDVISRAAAVIDIANDVLDIQVVDLRENPFLTPTPTLRPSETPTVTPEPTATPAPRSRDDVIFDLFDTVEQYETNGRLIAQGAIGAASDPGSICNLNLFVITPFFLSTDEAASFTDIANLVQSPDNSLVNALAQGQRMMDTYNSVCPGSPSGTDIAGLQNVAGAAERDAQAALTLLENTFGPSPTGR